VGLELETRTNELSAGSVRALGAALALARSRGAAVDLVHSIATDHYVEGTEGGCVLVHEGLSRAGRSVLEEARGRLTAEGLACEVFVSDDKAAFAITRQVLRSGADLALIGKHDARVDGSPLGSVASKLVRKCPGMVWVVDPLLPERPQRVLCATDLSAVGARAIAVGADLAAPWGARVHVVHAYQIPMSEQLRAGRGESGVLDALRREVTARVEGQLAEVELATPPELHVGCSAPEQGILSVLERVRPDLLVMGTVSRGGIAGFLMGYTAERVLPRVKCSLLVVKPDDFISPIQLED